MIDQKLLEQVVLKNKTLAGVIIDLGLRRHGNTYRKIKALIYKYGINVQHFWEPIGREKRPPNLNCSIRPIEAYLVKGIAYRTSWNLKQRLITAGLFVEKCYECGIGPVWNSKNLVLQLDHINGDNTDNSITNLRFLCPNCHSQTNTYCGKHRKKKKPAHACCSCGGATKGEGKTGLCRKCVGLQQRKISRPPTTVLLQELSCSSFRALARKYGVSDNSIRKWARSLD